MSLNSVIVPTLLDTGQSVSITVRPTVLTGRPNVAGMFGGDSLLYTLGAVRVGSSDTQVSLTITDTSSGGRPLVSEFLDVTATDAAFPTNLPDLRNVKIEPVPEELQITITCTSGKANVVLLLNTETQVWDEFTALGVSCPFQNVIVTGANTTVDMSLGNNIYLQLNASTTLAFTNYRDGERYLFWVRQGGGFTIAWPAAGLAGGVLWRASAPPIITAAAAAIDVIVMMWSDAAARFVGSYDQAFG